MTSVSLREITAKFPHIVEIPFRTYAHGASTWLLCNVLEGDWTVWQTGFGGLQIYFKDENKAV
jgi:hypothetical protein